MCPAVEKRRHPAESARTAAMRDVVAWMFNNELGTEQVMGGTSASGVPALFTSLEGLARAESGPAAP